MITLIIVDCQNDFISGSMSVKGAKEAVENIKKFIKQKSDEIEKIIFTIDWHPYNHCSFKREGGNWPSHCVQYTPGACIEPKLLKLVQSLNINYEVSQKGCIEEVEEYGAFSDITSEIDNFGYRIYLDIIEVNPSSEFIVCGIAGDLCVASTLENMLEADITPEVFLKGVASIDDGTVIDQFIKTNSLKVYE